jgi:hypothetical protein
MGRRFMRDCSRVTLLGLLGISILGGPAFAQRDSCAEQGPDCRLLTSAEVGALKARLLALRAALPVPDSERWAPPPDLGEAYTMSFLAELNLGGTMTCGSWPAGAFTERNDVHFVYDGRQKPGEPAAEAKDKKDPLAWVQGMQAAIGNRMEVSATLLPHPYLVDNVDGKCVDVSDPEATNIEKTATFLSWESSEGTILIMVFGSRTCAESETERVGKPAPALAPVGCITLEITGPNQAEIAALKKKIDRRAFAALLGAVTK